MKNSKGQAAILVMLFLAVGSLVIVPVLRYLTSGLRSQRVYEQAIAKEYATDGAIEDALLKLVVGLGLGPANPAYNYNFSGRSVNIQIPSVPASQDYGSGNVHHFMIQVTKVPRTTPTPYDPSVAVGMGAAFDPENWISGTGAVTMEYIIRIQTQQWTSLNNISFTLPVGLTYNAGSTRYILLKQNQLAWDTKVNMSNYTVQKKDNSWQALTFGSGLSAYQEVTTWTPPGYNANQSYLYISNGGRTLSWKPKITTESGNCVFIQTIRVTGNPPPWGILYVTSVSTNQLPSVIEKTAAIGVAMYTVVVTVEGKTYQVVVSYDAATQSMKIISYNIVG